MTLDELVTRLQQLQSKTAGDTQVFVTTPGWGDEESQPLGSVEKSADEDEYPVVLLVFDT